MNILKAELDRLLEGGFITQVTNTEWISPVVIVPKKGGKWRICVNYKALNAVTRKDRQPLPFIDELLDEVAGHDVCSFFDGYSGYHQVAIHEEDVLKTTFTTPWGTFAYLRMPFGLCNAGGTFQRVQTKIFGPYIGKFIRVYLDDFAVYSNRDSHIENVRAAFERLMEFHCSLSPEKCRIGFEEGALLGHIVSREGIRVDPDKVKRILELRIPESPQEVLSLWGMTNYHNRFIENLAGIVKPITSLIRKSTPFEWGPSCDSAMDYIKRSLSKDLVVRHPAWDKPFILNPSASELAVAAVLMQNDSTGRAHLVYFASRLLNAYEQKYPSTEKLTIALLFACIKFKHYMLSNPHPVVVESPQEGLKQVLLQTHPIGRIAKFLAVLQQYDLVFKTGKGQRSSHAKILLDLGTPPESIEETSLSDLECFVIVRAEDQPDFGYQALTNYLRSLEFPPGSTSLQRKDIRRRSAPFTLIDDQLYRTGGTGFCEEQSVEKKLKSSSHSATKERAAITSRPTPQPRRCLQPDISGRVFSKTAIIFVEHVRRVKPTVNELFLIPSCTLSFQLVPSKNGG